MFFQLKLGYDSSTKGGSFGNKLSYIFFLDKLGKVGSFKIKFGGEVFMSVNKGTANPASKSLFPTYNENEKYVMLERDLFPDRKLL